MVKRASLHPSMTTASTTIVSPSTVTAMSLLASHAAMGNVSPLGYSHGRQPARRLRKARGSPALRGERHSVGFQHNFGGLAVVIELKSRRTMLNKTPSRYSSTQMPIAYWPGMVGVQVVLLCWDRCSTTDPPSGSSQEKPVTYGTSTYGGVVGGLGCALLGSPPCWGGQSEYTVVPSGSTALWSHKWVLLHKATGGNLETQAVVDAVQTSVPGCALPAHAGVFATPKFSRFTIVGLRQHLWYTKSQP